MHRFHHVGTDADIVYNETEFFAWVFAVDTADCLHERMLLQRLVVVEISQAINIKTGSPHIHNDSDAQIGMFLLESVIKFFDALFVAEIIVHIFWVVLTASGYHGDCRYGL